MFFTLCAALRCFPAKILAGSRRITGASTQVQSSRSTMHSWRRYWAYWQYNIRHLIQDLHLADSRSGISLIPCWVNWIFCCCSNFEAKVSRLYQHSVLPAFLQQHCWSLYLPIEMQFVRVMWPVQDHQINLRLKCLVWHEWVDTVKVFSSLKTSMKVCRGVQNTRGWS